MKISVKIALFSSIFLATMVFSVAYFVIIDLYDRGEIERQAFRNATIAEVKQNLKDLVDVAYKTIDQNYSNLQDKKFLEKYYGNRLRTTIDAVESILKYYHELAKAGKMTEAEAQKQSLSIIEQIRYDGVIGYIWVNDTSRPFPKMLMHPTLPALNGQVLDDPKYNTAMGTNRNLFQAFLEVCERQGEGFVDYLWPKPSPQGLMPDVPKLSYVRHFRPWDWIIGTGIYIDDARRDILNKITTDIKAMRYADGTGYFWINDNIRPYPKMVMHPTIPNLDGRVLDDTRYNNAMGREQNLFEAFLDVTEADREGYIDYLWPKPTPDGLTRKQPKLSFVKLHKPLGWIIGTGVYIDSVEETVARKKAQLDSEINALIKKISMIALIVIAISVAISFAFANTLANPIAHLTRIAENISLGKDLDKKIAESRRKDEIGTLAQAVDRLKTSVKIMMDRLKK
ncbi:MAG: methyl-accepting chemotaxis protein [Candidatus Thiodiazotropha sp. (ex Epidulcina cf. delphinae)]|nr:methyl-accepting chemotaxis protein [Candidatus Thiodiazotropha sp. (ex Epidulcina cf. delphinae)]